MPVRCCTDDAQSSLLGTPILCALVVCNTGNVITAYGFNTAFSPWPSSNMSVLKCSEHIRLSFTGTNLVGLLLFTFSTLLLYSPGFFTESGNLQHNKYSCYCMNILGIYLCET